MIVTPILSPYLVNLTGTANLQTSEIVIFTSGGDVDLVLPSTPRVGSPTVTIVALSDTANISLDSGVVASVGGSFVSGAVASVTAGAFKKATVANSIWLIA